MATEQIDVHIHALPRAYQDALTAAGGDQTGYPTPRWSLKEMLQSMDEVGTAIGIVSLSTPGVPIAGKGREARKLAREINAYLGSVITSDEAHGRLGFFAALPDWRDVDGTLAEIEYLYGLQRLCNGVTVFTSYGNKLLSDPLFRRIWDALQAAGALVFVHPGTLDAPTGLIARALPQPIVDFPLATTRAAVDLVLSGTVRRCPDVDFILSHAGGTLPFLGSRAIGSLLIPDVGSVISLDISEAQEDFARFYYDIALSTSSEQLYGLLEFADSSRILFGSDYPYAPQPLVHSSISRYANFVATDPRGSQLAPDRMRQNSMTLLRKHGQNMTFNIPSPGNVPKPHI